MAPLMSSHTIPSASGSRLSSQGGAEGKGKPTSRLLSKVNSFTREWEDDGENKPEPEFTITGSKLSSRSPSVQESAPASVPIAADTGASADVDAKALARQRRRAAIMAAMSQPADQPGPSSTPVASSSTNFAPVPSASFYPATKRQMPWEESLADTKRVATERAVKPVKKTPLNIKQKVVLSSEQQRVLQLVVNDGKSLFFTGSAGTGKSVLLREIIASLRKKYASTPDAVAVTASTGIAACNIGGITLHSFGGFGLGLDEPKALVGKMRKNKKAVARWMRTKVLIIDEVSMVDAELFDKLSKVGSLLRKGKNSDKPFGGMQVVVTGDFFQLPPVTKGGAQPKFAFEAEMWGEAMSMSINLTKVFRQSDQTFVDMLNEMRFGRLTPESINKFRSLARPIHYDDGIEPTELFPMRNQVEQANHLRMSALNTEGWTYRAQDSGSVVDPVQREKILSNFMASSELHLKVNAQVMLIKNLDENLVNGSMGKVIGFCHKAHFPTDGREWSPDGQMEVAADTDAKGRLKKLPVAPGSKPHPVVRFKVPGGHQVILVEGTDFKTELPTGEIQAARIQLPLIPAWAMSIHKSQGQTLDRVKVDLQKVFEKGQAYVALSRATSLEGLQLTNFRPETVKAHPKVAQWSATLSSLD